MSFVEDTPDDVALIRIPFPTSDKVYCRGSEQDWTILGLKLRDRLVDV